MNSVWNNPKITKCAERLNTDIFTDCLKIVACLWYENQERNCPGFSEVEELERKFGNRTTLRDITQSMVDSSCFSRDLIEFIRFAPIGDCINNVVLKAENLNETEVRCSSGDGRRSDRASSPDDHQFSRWSNDVIVEDLYRNSRIALKIP